MIKFFQKLLDKKNWSRKEKQAYRPSSEEDRVTEERIRNTKRLLEYYFKKDSFIKKNT